jgi:hypothetical protein
MRFIEKFAKPWTAMLMMLAASACLLNQPDVPPTATVTELATATRAAKSPNCYMPVLYAEPVVDFQKVALVDGWGSLKSSQAEVLEVVKRKACETGADALVVLTTTAQERHNLLYTAEPNPARQAGADTQVGDYINDREKIPEIGSVGHPGTYVDAIAIIYPAPGAKP